MTNRDVLDWFKKLEDKSDKSVADGFKQKFFNFDSTPRSLVVKINRLNDKVKKLSKNKKLNQKEQLLSEHFDIPEKVNQLERAQAACSTEKELALTEDLHLLKKDNKALKRKLENYDDICEVYENKLQDIKELSSNLAECVKSKKIARKELESFKEAYDKKEKELDGLEAKFNVLKIESTHKGNTIRNLNKKLKRREQSLSSKTIKIKTFEKEKHNNFAKIKLLKDSVSGLESKIENIQFQAAEILGEKECLRKKVFYLNKTPEC